MDDETERAALWVKRRLHETQVKQTIVEAMTSDPQAIQELVTDWTPVIAHLEERPSRRRLRLPN